jgi:hypothetical protein
VAAEDDPEGYYRALGLAPTATQAQIHHAYREWVKIFHPDRSETADTAAFCKIKDAYDTLKDQRLRAQYDALGRNQKAQASNALTVRRSKGISKGAVIGILIGCASLVTSNVFKGNLFEREFAAEYIGYLIPATVIGGVVGHWVRQRRPHSGKSRFDWLFAGSAAFLSLVIVIIIAWDFPRGDGLLHPTHAALARIANKACLTRQGALDPPQPEIADFCSCFAERVVGAVTDRGTVEPPILVAQHAVAACVAHVSPNAASDMPQAGGALTGDVTAQLSAEQRGAIGDKVRECWTKDTGSLDLDKMSVQLIVTTDEAGVAHIAVVGEEDRARMSDPRFRKFAERAIHAVLDAKCAALPLPKDHLGRVNELTFRFRP